MRSSRAPLPCAMKGSPPPGRPGTITYSRKVFVPLTTLCRDRCHYCVFVDTPGQLRLKRAPLYMSDEQILLVARAGRDRGCKEALLTLGDRPEDRWPEARAWLDEHGFASTLDYVGHAARLITAETGLLAHLNPGVMTAAELHDLRPTAPSMGMMLETTSRAIYDEPGGAHYGSPDKDPAVRLQVIADAGSRRHPVHDRNPRRDRRERPRPRRVARRASRPPGAARPRAGGHRPELPREAGHRDAIDSGCRVPRVPRDGRGRPDRARPAHAHPGAAEPQRSGRARPARARRDRRLGRRLAAHRRSRQPGAAVAAPRRPRGADRGIRLRPAGAPHGAPRVRARRGPLDRPGAARRGRPAGRPGPGLAISASRRRMPRPHPARRCRTIPPNSDQHAVRRPNTVEPSEERHRARPAVRAASQSAPRRSRPRSTTPSGSPCSPRPATTSRPSWAPPTTCAATRSARPSAWSSTATSPRRHLRAAPTEPPTFGLDEAAAMARDAVELGATEVCVQGALPGDRGPRPVPRARARDLARRARACTCTPTGRRTSPTSAIARDSASATRSRR